MREGKVTIAAGYDGEYGVVKIFDGNRALSKGEIEAARSLAEVSHSVHAAKKSSAQLQREIDEALAERKS